tara:strand:- start:211 stop:435 length:225 start_codon:yes stop_codon:yes gene_type:complete
MILFSSFGSPLSDLVSLPFKAYSSIPVDPLSLKLIGALPIVAFIALLLAAIWRQAKKYPTRIIQSSDVTNIRNF